jgi:hypothetical protein
MAIHMEALQNRNQFCIVYLHFHVTLAAFKLTNPTIHINLPPHTVMDRLFSKDISFGEKGRGGGGRDMDIRNIIYKTTPIGQLPFLNVFSL